MSFTIIDDITDTVSTLLGAVSSKLTSDALEQAANDALVELHWSLPITDNSQKSWVVKRAKRHALAILLVESADKFQYKKIYLHHRFNQYFKLIEFLDKDFQNALENNPTLFDVDTWGNLGDYVTNGFNYDRFGVDHSYDDWM